MATIGLAHVDNPLEFGIVITREDGSIERFLEKPTWGQVFSDTINTGIFVLEPEIFDYIEDGRPVDFSGEVFPGLLRDGKPPLRCRHRGLLGGRRHPRLLRARPQGHPRREGARRDPRLRDPSAASGWARTPSCTPTSTIVGPAVIGENCRVEADAVIGEYTVLGANVRIRQDAFLERTVVHDNAYLGEGVRLRGTVVGRSCDLRKGVRTEEGVVLGDECFVGDEASIGAEVKIYPFKTVEAGAVVNESIVWESRGARSLFGADGVNGLANVDITPEFAVRVAMAYGSAAQAGRHGHHLAGLESLGPDAEAGDHGGPQRRRRQRRGPRGGLDPGHPLRHAPPHGTGGLTVRLDRNDPQSVVIRFFDDDGLDITEEVQRKIERLFAREDFRRVFPGEIGDIGFAPRALEHYTTALGVHRRCRPDPRRGGSRSSSTTPTARPRSPCPTCWPSSGSRCWPSIRSSRRPAC